MYTDKSFKSVIGGIRTRFQTENLPTNHLFTSGSKDFEKRVLLETLISKLQTAKVYEMSPSVNKFENLSKFHQPDQHGRDFRNWESLEQA